MSVNNNTIILYTMSEVNVDNDLLIYECPHCKMTCITAINEINCGIFRHGMDKKTNQQINPHESKEKCDQLATNTDIIGCCKPYKISKVADKYTVEICDYV
jgi:hypothetical protein